MLTTMGRGDKRGVQEACGLGHGDWRYQEVEKLMDGLMDRLAITSRNLQLLVLALLVLTPVAVALAVGMGAWVDLLRVPPSILLDTDRITGTALLAVVAVASIKPAAYMLAFWFLYELLRLYRDGIIFSAANVWAIRKIGWALVGVDIAGAVQSLLTGPVLTVFDISQRHISLGFDVALLTVGLFIVLIARVMDLGRELKEQDSLVI